MIILSLVVNWEIGFLKWKGGLIQNFINITLNGEVTSVDFKQNLNQIVYLKLPSSSILL